MSAAARVLLPLRRFRRWWLGELSAAFGVGGPQGAGADRRPRIELDLETDDWYRDGAPVPQGALPRGPVVVRLTGGSVLTHEVDLPAAAEENLRQVLTFEMDRQTPFRADDVLFDYRVAERGEGRLRVLMAVTPRLAVENRLAALQAAGVRPEALVPEAEPDLDLLPAEFRPRPRRVAGILNALLLVSALGLAAVALALPLVRKIEVVQRLEPRVAEARAEAREVRELRDGIEELRQTLAFAIREKQRAPRVLDLWDEVTRLLPDDTWLREMDYSDGTLQLRGETSSAPRVVALLEASDMLADVRFLAPVTQGRDGREEFFLAAQVATGSPGEGG